MSWLRRSNKSAKVWRPQGPSKAYSLSTLTAVKRPSQANPGLGSRNNNRRRKLVRRVHLATIVAAWVVTVPVTAVMAGAIFFALRAAY